MKSTELFEKRLKCVADARAIFKRSEDEKRQPNPDEQRQFDEFMNEADTLHTEAQRLFRLETAERQSAETQGRAVPPGTPGAPENRQAKGPTIASPEYRAAYDNYLRSGPYGISASDARMIDEVRAVSQNPQTSGGYMAAPQEFNSELIKFVNNLVFIRQLAKTTTVATAQSLGQPSLDTDPADADWTSELATGSEDSSFAFGKRELIPRPLAKRIKVSNKLLRMVPQTEPIVRERLGYKFAVTEEKSFLTGDGATQPLGVFTASAGGISTGRDVTAAANNAVAANDFLDCYFNLKQQYMDSKNLRWVIGRTVMKAVRKLKDSNNQYLWQPGGFGSNMDYGRQETLLGIPVCMSEYAPQTLTTGLYVAILGDFGFYHIVDALTMTVQRLAELYAETNQTGFIGRIEVDGMPVLEEAFSRLKLA